MEPAAAPNEPQGAPAPAELGASPEPAPSIAPEAGAAQSTDRGGWLRNALRPFMRDAAPREEPDEQAEGEQSDEPEAPWSAPTWGSRADYDRWLESQNRSYADRRDSARERRDAQRAADELAAAVAQLEQQKQAALRDDDLWQVGELEKEIARKKAGPGGNDSLDAILGELRSQVAGETVAHFDQILDKLVLRVPERERSALFPSDEEAEGLPPWEQRMIVADRVADALEKRAKDAESARLRKDPVFRKELMAEFQTTPGANESEPVLTSTAPNGGGPTSMNDFLRSVKNRR